MSCDGSGSCGYCLQTRAVACPVLPGRIEFPTGYVIDVDEIWDGQVLYRVWPPGVETQGMFDRAFRKPIYEFERLVAAELGIQRSR